MWLSLKGACWLNTGSLGACHQKGQKTMPLSLFLVWNVIHYFLLPEKERSNVTIAFWQLCDVTITRTEPMWVHVCQPQKQWYTWFFVSSLCQIVTNVSYYRRWLCSKADRGKKEGLSMVLFTFRFMGSFCLFLVSIRYLSCQDSFLNFLWWIHFKICSSLLFVTLSVLKLGYRLIS